MYVVCTRGAQAEVRERMVARLEAANYPVRDVGQHAFGRTEIEATLYAMAGEADALNAAMAEIERLPGVLQAFWNAGSEA
ncbi:hypothetical protein M5C99_02975 [Acidovorax sp. NCPPB 2350]|nr:hypothetical protein M5C99_02975 [Acidovorax sp. NCPPB 2350]